MTASADQRFWADNDPLHEVPGIGTSMIVNSCDRRCDETGLNTRTYWSTTPGVVRGVKPLTRLVHYLVGWRSRAPGSSPLCSLPSVHDVDPLVANPVAPVFHHVHGEHPWSAVIADQILCHYKVVTYVTDYALDLYRGLDQDIKKLDVFYYDYGMLHSPRYRTAYEADLRKSLPRIPQVESADDFWAFSQAGRDLSRLHTEYDQVEPWQSDLAVQITEGLDASAENLYRVTKMRYANDEKTAIVYNDHFTIAGIRWTTCKRVAQLLTKEDCLRDGITQEEATDLLWAMTSAHAYEDLVIERRWTKRRVSLAIRGALTAGPSAN